MRQADLNRAVSRATGESVSTIQRLGFGLADSPNEQPDRPVIDWDVTEPLASHEVEPCCAAV
ncbi:MAG TPA: hypothetical protein VLA12_05380 [Planctomycetaceae bacterium]|nr:hypothetical protein [Planctomycetaceae bacterium]